MDVSGIMLPDTSREVIVWGVFVSHLTRVRSVMLSQEGASQQSWKSARVDMCVVVASAKSQCGQTIPPRIRRRSL